MSAEYLFMTDKLYDVKYDTGDKVIQCGRHNDIFKLWLQWRAKVGIKREHSSIATLRSNETNQLYPLCIRTIVMKYSAAVVLRNALAMAYGAFAAELDNFMTLR
jgi:hypothetical protein